MAHSGLCIALNIIVQYRYVGAFLLQFSMSCALNINKLCTAYGYFVQLDFIVKKMDVRMFLYTFVRN